MLGPFDRSQWGNSVIYKMCLVISNVMIGVIIESNYYNCKLFILLFEFNLLNELYFQSFFIDISLMSMHSEYCSNLQNLQQYVN